MDSQGIEIWLSQFEEIQECTLFCITF